MTQSRGDTPSESASNFAYRPEEVVSWSRSIDVPRKDSAVPLPENPCFESTLTDFYQITMAYAYWHSSKHMLPSVFDLFFRKCPFGGEFTILAGVEEAVRFINSFHFTNKQIDYLRQQLPHVQPEFFDWLGTVDCSEVTVYAIREGSIVFPREPLLRVEGPLAICQLLETPLLNLLNYPSLIATNAARHRLVAGPSVQLLEFGTRRAQGPDGAMSASRYSYLGGFDGTSNVRAGHHFGIPILGTHAHAFVTSFTGMDNLSCLPRSLGQVEDFPRLVLEKKDLIAERLPDIAKPSMQNEGELAAFTAYAMAFPSSCLCLIDTYNTLYSGLMNFLVVALALIDAGYTPVGIRLDSGDLAYLSKECRSRFKACAEEFSEPHLSKLRIVASNDINERVLISLKEQGHEVDSFGVGTHLVTCQSQPALGMVYKLAELGGVPRMKLSEDMGKTSIPAKKNALPIILFE